MKKKITVLRKSKADALGRLQNNWTKSSRVASIVFLGLVLSLFTLNFSPFAFAEDDEESTKARARAYPGGKDEDRIQVQASLPDPEKKYTDKAIQNQVIKRPASSEN